MDITVNQAEIGRRIREIRKKKGLTQKDVWAGLFSSGKYSSIERGTWNLTNEDLEAICLRLGIEKKEILPEEPEIPKVKSSIMTALYNIKIGLLKVARITLEEIRPHIKETPSMQLYYLFAWGEYYIQQEEYEKAIYYFSQITNTGTTSFFDQENKIRAFNALAYLSYKKLNVSEAAEIGEESIEYLSNITGEFKKERAITYYNNAIFQCYLKNYEYARDYIYQAMRYSQPNKIDKYILVNAIIDIQSEAHSRNIKKTLEDLADTFFRENDIVSYTKVLFCQYYVYRKENSSVTEFLVNIGRKLSSELKSNISALSAENHSEITQLEKDSIETLNILATIAYYEKDYRTALKFITLCYSFARDRNLDNDLIWARIHLMYAKLQNTFLKDPKEEEFFIDKALHHLEKFPNSLERGLLLYEKAKLTNQLKKDDIVSESLEIFYKNAMSTYFSKIVLTRALPLPEY